MGSSFWFFTAMSAAVMLSAPLVAQKIGMPVRVNPNNTNATTTKPDTTNTTSSANSSTASLYVDGKVMVQDGGALPQNVVILKNCGSRRALLGYADYKGNFSVKLLGNNVAALSDASDNSRDSLNSNSNLNNQQQLGSALMGCEIQASSPGYRSESIDLGSRRLMDNPNIGTLVIKRIASGEGTTVSQTMLTAPKNAVKAYDQGMLAVRKGDRASAVKNFEKAVALHPIFANPWYELGHLNLIDNAEAARADLEKALAADSKYLPPYSDLALLAYRSKNWQETVKITDQGLRLDSSGSPDLYYYNAAAQFNQKNLAEAEKKARECVKVDFSHSLPKAPQLLSYILAAKGDYSGAVEQMHAYIASGLAPEEAERSKKQLAALQSKADESAKK